MFREVPCKPTLGFLPSRCQILGAWETRGLPGRDVAHARSRRAVPVYLETVAKQLFLSPSWTGLQNLKTMPVTRSVIPEHVPQAVPVLGTKETQR